MDQHIAQVCKQIELAIAEIHGNLARNATSS